MILTNYFIKRKINALAKRSAKRSHHFQTLDEVKDILVFYDIRNWHEVEPHLKKLRTAQKKVKECVYIPQGIRPDIDTRKVQLFAVNDLDLWNFPTKEITENLKSIKADILIDLCDQSCLPMQYLMLLHPAPFKVGGKREDQDVFDLSISVTGKGNIDYLFRQILFYLETIRSK